MSNVDQLRIAVDELTALKFPKHADDDALEDWLMELLEMDGHVAGLASRVLGGGVQARPLPSLAHLIAALGLISVKTPHDRAVLDSSRRYLDGLERVVAALDAVKRT